jgi:hypothetical protein
MSDDGNRKGKGKGKGKGKDIPASSEADVLDTDSKQVLSSPEESSQGEAESGLTATKSAVLLAETILTEHRKEFHEYLAGKDIHVVPKWAVDIEKLIRIDKKTPENIREVILWVKTPNNFWFHNIESGAKLRKHFERLFGQMKTEKSGPSPPSKRNWDHDFDISQPQEVIVCPKKIRRKEH